MERTRIQLDMTDAMVELIDRLVGDTGATTRAEVLRRAISIYGLLVDEQTAGKQLELVTKKGRRERVLLT